MSLQLILAYTNTKQGKCSQ